MPRETRVEARLAEQLDAKDAEIEELRGQLDEAENKLESARSGWALPRKIAETEGLPVPRLEFFWTPEAPDDWGNFVVEYRLVRRHLLGHLEVVPFGRTKVQSGNGGPPWGRWAEETPRSWLPFRDGCHASHDAIHLGLKIFAHGPTGPVEIDPTPSRPRSTP